MGLLVFYILQIENVRKIFYGTSEELYSDDFALFDESIKNLEQQLQQSTTSNEKSISESSMPESLPESAETDIKPPYLELKLASGAGETTAYPVGNAQSLEMLEVFYERIGYTAEEFEALPEREQEELSLVLIEIVIEQQTEQIESRDESTQALMELHNVDRYYKKLIITYEIPKKMFEAERCMEENKDINFPDIPGVTTLCGDDSVIWPVLPEGWIYDVAMFDTQIVSDGSFDFSLGAKNESDGFSYSCNSERECVDVDEDPLV